MQLPFLQQLLGDFTFVPICLGAQPLRLLRGDRQRHRDVVAAEGEPVGILASSDLNHYEDQKTTLRKDQLAIEEVLALDPRELWRVVDEFDISMCGFIPTTAMLIAAKQARRHRGTTDQARDERRHQWRLRSCRRLRVDQ